MSVQLPPDESVKRHSPSPPPTLLTAQKCRTPMGSLSVLPEQVWLKLAVLSREILRATALSTFRVTSPEVPPP